MARTQTAVLGPQVEKHIPGLWRPAGRSRVPEAFTALSHAPALPAAPGMRRRGGRAVGRGALILLKPPPFRVSGTNTPNSLYPPRGVLSHPKSSHMPVWNAFSSVPATAQQTDKVSLTLKNSVRPHLPRGAFPSPPRGVSSPGGGPPLRFTRWSVPCRDPALLLSRGGCLHPPGPSGRSFHPWGLARKMLGGGHCESQSSPFVVILFPSLPSQAGKRVGSW